MKTRIQKWGNSLALRIPKSFAEEVQLSQGTQVEVSLKEGKLLVSPVLETPFSLDELLAGVTEENLHQEIDTGRATGNEIW